MKPVPFILLLGALLSNCTKEGEEPDWIESTYSGSYKNITYTESVAGEYGPGIYKGDQIPADIMHMEYGRIEIDFRYNGGGLTYFAPLFYYGSMNKNDDDDWNSE